MNIPDHAANLIRRARIAAALRVVDHEIDLVDPFVMRFASALATHLTIGSEDGWPVVWAGTRSDRDGVARWLDFVDGRSGGTRSLRPLLETSASDFDVSVGAVRGEAAPALAIETRSEADTGEVLHLASTVGARPAAAALLEGARTLLAERLIGLGARQERPGGAFSYEARFRWRLAPDQHAVFGERIVRMAKVLGMSAAHGRFAADMLAALAPRALNELEFALPFDGNGLAGRFSIVYPAVPARLVLRLTTLLNGAPLDGKRLGVLAAASGVRDDVVSTVWLEVRAGAGPRVGFAFTSPPEPLE